MQIICKLYHERNVNANKSPKIYNCIQLTIVINTIFVQTCGIQTSSTYYLFIIASIQISYHSLDTINQHPLIDQYIEN